MKWDLFSENYISWISIFSYTFIWRSPAVSAGFCFASVLHVGQCCYTQLNTFPICAPETVAAVLQQRVKTEQMGRKWNAVSSLGLKMPQTCKENLWFVQENNFLTVWWKTNSETPRPPKTKIWEDWYECTAKYFIFFILFLTFFKIYLYICIYIYVRNCINLNWMRKVTFPSAQFHSPRAIEMKMKIPFLKHEKRNILVKAGKKIFNSPPSKTL